MELLLPAVVEPLQSFQHSIQEAHQADTREEMSLSLSNVAEDFIKLFPKNPSMDRDTFNLDFDLKSLKDKLKDEKDQDLALLKHEFKSLLETAEAWLKHRPNLNKKMLDSREQLALERKKNNPKEVTEALNRSESLRGTIEFPKSTHSLPSALTAAPVPELHRESLDQVNHLISEQHETVNQLKQATENLQRLSQEATKADQAASKDQVQATEAARIAAELALNTDLIAAQQRQAVLGLSEAVRQAGLTADRLGRTERICAEFIASESRTKNILEDFNEVLKSIRSAIEVLNKQDNTAEIVYDVVDQIIHAESKVSNALSLVQDFNQYLNNLLGVLRNKTEQAKGNYQKSVEAQKEKEQLYKQIQAEFIMAQNKAIEQQNSVAALNQRAYQSAQQTEELRKAVKEALITQQRAGAARAIVADKVRLAIQEAAQFDED